MIPLEIDPPDHRKYRAMIDPMVSPRTVATMEASIRDLANRLIDRSSIRAVRIHDGLRQAPAGFGFPGADGPAPGHARHVRWLGHGLAACPGSTDRRTLHARDRRISQKAIAEKKQRPDDSVLSAIVHGKADGGPLTPQEVFGFTFFLFIAGLDTVFATLNNVFLWLAQNPERRREIIAHPDQSMGWSKSCCASSPLTFSGRTLTQDYEMRG